MKTQGESNTDERCLTWLVDELRGLGAIVAERPLSDPELRRLVLLLSLLRDRLNQIVIAAVLVGRATAAYAFWAQLATNSDQPVPAGLNQDLVNQLTELLDRTASDPAVATRWRRRRARRLAPTG